MTINPVSESRIEHGGNKNNATRQHWPHYVTGEAAAVLRALAELIEAGRAVGPVAITEDGGYRYATGLYR